MRALIIDNNISPDCWGSPDLRRSVASVPGITLTVRRGPQDDFPRDLSRFDRIILSGSYTSCLDEAPWIAHEDELIRRALDESKPLLAICYGHQALARVLGGKKLLRKSQTPEFGWTKIERRIDDPIFEGLPRAFHTFSSHFEEVSELPPGTKLLASSESCEVQAFRVEGKPAVGVQFHPERNLEEAIKTISDWKRKKDGRPLSHPDESTRHYDPKVVATIFGNFLKGASALKGFSE